MTDFATFFMAVGIMVGFLGLISLIVFVIGYWINVLNKKYKLGLLLKYKMLKRKYPLGDIEMLKDTIEDPNNNLREEDVYKKMLLSGMSRKRVEELFYLYKKVYDKKLKGGLENGKRSE